MNNRIASVWSCEELGLWEDENSMAMLTAAYTLMIDAGLDETLHSSYDTQFHDSERAY